VGTRPIGNTLVLSGTIQALTDLQINCNGITLRSELGNQPIYFYDQSSAVRIGYLLQGESMDFNIISPHRIVVQGTEGNLLYWLGVIE
jgi:hypothetical protein